MVRVFFFNGGFHHEKQDLTIQNCDLTILNSDETYGFNRERYGFNCGEHGRTTKNSELMNDEQSISDHKHWDLSMLDMVLNMKGVIQL